MKDEMYIGNIPADNKIFFNLLLNNVEDQKLELTLPIEPLKSYLDKEENIKIDKDTVNTAFNIIKGSSKTTLIDRENGTFQTDIKLKDRKSTRLNSSHVSISYAVFCLKK